MIDLVCSSRCFVSTVLQATHLVLYVENVSSFRSDNTFVIELVDERLAD